MFRKTKEKVSFEDIESVGETLCRLYSEKLLPFEKYYKFHELVNPKLEDADFTSSPIIMFIGQYSTGKTTFIRYMLGEEYPSSRIGPEPTTDTFVAIMHGEVSQIIPGNAATANPKNPLRALSQYGNNFLSRFSVAEMKNELCKHMTIIDTPGILSGSKQTKQRRYPFVNVVKTIGERCERILFIFDAHKLDISDEFREVIEALKHHENKIRIALNKSDRVSDQELMRVYGALMWSLGKIMLTPEVTRVYIGSFWDEPFHNDSFRKLFQAEEMDLIRDIASVPRSCLIRRLNDLISRARSATVVAHCLVEIYNRLPTFFKESKKGQICEGLPQMFQQIATNKCVSLGDFPDVEMFAEKLKHLDFNKLPGLKNKLFDDVNSLISVDLPKLIEKLAKQTAENTEGNTLKGGLFSALNENKEDSSVINPFDAGASAKMKFGINSDSWVVDEYRAVYDEQFDRLNPINGKIPGSVAKEHLQKSNLSNLILMKIWRLSDIDKDGCLDRDEFALCKHLIEIQLDNIEIPNVLPESMIPPSKRKQVQNNLSPS